MLLWGWRSLAVHLWYMTLLSAANLEFWPSALSTRLHLQAAQCFVYLQFGCLVFFFFSPHNILKSSNVAHHYHSRKVTLDYSEHMYRLREVLNRTVSGPLAIRIQTLLAPGCFGAGGGYVGQEIDTHLVGKHLI